MSATDVLLTVGMSRWPFDRLVQGVARLAAEHRVFAQIGHSGVVPPCEHARFVAFDELAARVAAAGVVVTHAGNTVRMVQRAGKVPIVVARRAALGEMANDHQVEFLRHEERRGRVVAVWDVDELPAAVARHREAEAALMLDRPGPRPRDGEQVAELLDGLLRAQAASTRPRPRGGGPGPGPLRGAPSAVAAVREKVALGGFVAGLAVKQRLRPAHHVRPLVAELFLTDNCNLRCVTCNCWRETTEGELSTDEWRGVLRQLAALPIRKVNFTGGEPLIRRDAIELMAYARDLGIRRLHLNTNAIRLTAERRRRILDAGVRSFNVSVDGHDAPTHDAVRGREGAFAATRRHLEALVAERDRHGLRIRMNFTVMRDNVASLPRMAELAQSLRVRLYLNLATDRTFLFRADEVAARSQVAPEQLREAMRDLERMARADPRFLPRYSDLAYVGRHFAEPRQASLPCAESQLKLMVHSRGGIGGCWGHDPVHNVRQTPIADVIASDHYREEHARMFRKDCVGCGSNYSLNLRVRPSTYATDAAWRLGLRSLDGA